MEFPYTPKTDLQHRFGGKVLLVHGIKHQACEPRDGRSLDGWWFDCDVRWDDGKVARSPVESYKLCAEEGSQNPDIKALDAAMMEYLKTNARYCDDRTKHEGWYFKERAAKVAA